VTRLNQLCYQRAAAAAIIREQLEQQARLDDEIASIVGVSLTGGYDRVSAEDFEVEVVQPRGRVAQVYITERGK